MQYTAASCITSRVAQVGSDGVHRKRGSRGHSACRWSTSDEMSAAAQNKYITGEIYRGRACIGLWTEGLQREVGVM